MLDLKDILSDEDLIKEDYFPFIEDFIAACIVMASVLFCLLARAFVVRRLRV